jgi:uncharacterized membrane protein
MKNTQTKDLASENTPNEDRLTQVSSNATKIIGSPTSLLVHTLFFIGIFSLRIFNISFDSILLILTTIVSLEAIYLAIFIQMTVNINAQHLSMVKEDVEEIQEDVEEIQEDVEEIQEDVEEIQEDVEEIQEDVDEIQENTDEDEDIIMENKKEKSLSETIRKIEKDMIELKSLISLLNKEVTTKNNPIKRTVLKKK